MKKSVLGVAAAGVLFPVLLAGCSGSSTSASPSVSPSVSASESAEPVVSGPQPKVGECWNQPEISGNVQEGSPVDCEKPHTERTLAVIDLPEDFGSPYERDRINKALESVDAEKDKKEFQRLTVERLDNLVNSADLNPYVECQNVVNEAIGADPYQTAVFPYNVDVTFPTESQWAEGQRWARCNIAKRTSLDSSTLAPLPATLPTSTPVRFEYGHCEVGGKALECSKVKRKDVNSGEAYITVLDDLPRPARVKAAKHDDVFRMAQAACLRALPKSVDSEGLEPKHVRVSIGSYEALLNKWRTQGEGFSDGDGVVAWNADDAYIDCRVSAWRVAGAP